jgi:hypothetical protein
MELSNQNNEIRMIKSRRMRWAWDKRDGYRILVGKPEG